jgi:diaminobutyrate-2-oxoglutarate transaminase
MEQRLRDIADGYGFVVKGRGFMQGLEVADEALSTSIRRLCFANGLILEACGPRDTVIKLLPPLTISEDDLLAGLQILQNAVTTAVAAQPAARLSTAVAS